MTHLTFETLVGLREPGAEPGKLLRQRRCPKLGGLRAGPRPRATARRFPILPEYP